MRPWQLPGENRIMGRCFWRRSAAQRPWSPLVTVQQELRGADGGGGGARASGRYGLVGAVIMRGASITVGGIAILMLRELMLAYAAVVIYSGFRLVSSPPIGHGCDDDLR